MYIQKILFETVLDLTLVIKAYNQEYQKYVSYLEQMHNKSMSFLDLKIFHKTLYKIVSFEQTYFAHVRNPTLYMLYKVKDPKMCVDVWTSRCALQI